MVFSGFNDLTEAVKNSERKTVAVAGAHDEHALEAVLKASDRGLIDYILVGIADKILEIGKKSGHQIPVDKIIEENDPDRMAFKAVELIRENKGHFLMKGKMETAVIMKAVVNKETGIGTGGIMSHVAILEVPGYHKLLAITDGGMILSPDLEQKKAILKNAVDLFHRLGYDCPKVGVMAAVEVINPKMKETLDGAELKRLALEENLFGNCLVEGPISLDLAVSIESAKIKEYKSPVAGDADILLMPDIAAGNLTVKALYCIGGAKMAGCILGAKVPVVLSSRGASLEEKFISLLLSAALA